MKNFTRLLRLLSTAHEACALLIKYRESSTKGLMMETTVREGSEAESAAREYLRLEENLLWE